MQDQSWVSNKKKCIFSKKHYGIKDNLIVCGWVLMVITNLWGHINFKRLSSDNKKSEDFRNQDKHWIFQSTKFPWVPIHEVIIQSKYNVMVKIHRHLCYESPFGRRHDNSSHFLFISTSILLWLSFQWREFYLLMSKRKKWISKFRFMSLLHIFYSVQY